MKRHFQSKTMMAAKKRSTPNRKRSGGQSGGGNPRNGGRTSEEEHDDAMRVLRKEYYDGVRGLAQEVASRVKDGDDENDVLHEVVDGSYWVIYTHANFQVLMCSDHHDAYIEEFGTEGVVSGDSINWAALAFATLERDVREQVSAGLEEAPRMRSHRAVRSPRAGRPPTRRGR